LEDPSHSLGHIPRPRNQPGNNCSRVQVGHNTPPEAGSSTRRRERTSSFTKISRPPPKSRQRPAVNP
jgi:hypothetical protein